MIKAPAPVSPASPPLQQRSKEAKKGAVPLSPPFQAIPSLVLHRFVLHRQSSPFIPAFSLHNLLHPFLYFPPRLPQVYRPHKDAMPRLLIPIRKVEILIHGRVDQSSASIHSMRLAPVFLLVHHVRKNLREMIPANLLPAAKLRNQRLAVKLGIKNKLLLRIRIKKRHVGFHHR
jgi:hypothetical protein